MNADQYLFKHPLKRSAASVFDQLGGLFYPLFCKKPAEFNPQEVKRVLAIRLDHMGDVLMARPALKALAEAFPRAAIDLMVSEEFLPLLEGDTFIHRLIPVRHHWFQRSGTVLDHYQDFTKLVQEVKHEAYDLGIDFRGDFRNILLMALAAIPARLSYSLTGGEFLLTHRGDYDKKAHQVELNLRLLEKTGITPQMSAPVLQFDEIQRKALLEKFPVLKETSSKRIIIHMGAGYPTKRWSIDSYREVIARLVKSKSAKVILIGTKGERSEMPIVEYPGALYDLRGLLSLNELALLMEVCDYYIGNDSGPAHIAAAQKIPGLILFSGTNDAAVWQPWSERLEILQKTVPCAPCEAQTCPLKHHECMELIQPDEVLGKIQSHVKGAVS